MSLRHLRPALGSKKKRKRIGRGSGSGKGGTAGRGEKGQMSRSGARRKLGFEGGQLPIHRRLPKRGFTNIWREEVQVVHLKDLAKLPSGAEVRPETLKQAGLISSLRRPVKVLGDGDVSQPYVLRSVALSKSAREKILAAGGEVAQ
ncbi:MAG: 50S ribosomal protein L15 [bacterium]